MDPSPCSMPLSEIFLGQQLCWLSPLLSQCPAQPWPAWGPRSFLRVFSTAQKGVMWRYSHHAGRAGCTLSFNPEEWGLLPKPKGHQCPVPRSACPPPGSPGLHAHPPGPQVCMPTPRVPRSACLPPWSSFGGCWGFQGEASPGWFTSPSLAFAQVAQGRREL